MGWPIVLLLLAHAAFVPLQIPLAGAWRHPDPAEVNLMMLAIFEGAFVTVCAAYLFGGLAKDRIAANYRHDALTDPLTGIANRRRFFETGGRLLLRAGRARRLTALLMFDLDNFKSINDRFGHQAGDAVLIAFCRMVAAQMRPADLFGRIGGEEFAMLLPETGEQDALRLAERLRTPFAATASTVGKHAIDATVSVGVAISDGASSDLIALMKAADAALYRAKIAGRNRVKCARPRPEPRPAEARAWTGSDRDAKPAGSTGDRRQSALETDIGPIATNHRSGITPGFAAAGE